jgi:hypothetical protein
LLSQADIFERAEQCERASQAAADSQRKVMLELLRDMWIALANETPFLPEAVIEEQVRIIERIHASALECRQRINVINPQLFSRTPAGRA